MNAQSMTYFVGPILSLALLGIIVVQLLRKRLRERHAVWWAIGALIALVLSLFPSLLVSISSVLGFVAPLNFVLILAITLLLFVNLQHSSELTELEDRVRTLAEKVAELELEQESRTPND